VHPTFVKIAKDKLYWRQRNYPRWFGQCSVDVALTISHNTSLVPVIEWEDEPKHQKHREWLRIHLNTLPRYR
jgi:hypothetical protein